jgi:uncharacterized protein YfaS (alpha-2-macroglobulin family)
VLTEGDEIALPVVLRNYLDSKQAVDVEIKPEPWFAVSGPVRKRAEIDAGDAVRETFAVRAIASVTAGKQRITAAGPTASDAVEKPVSVHPDGQEIIQTASRLFDDQAALAVAFPGTTIKDTARAELRVYPNLMTHVLEAVEGIMQRPYGCAEQTISSAYPSLLALRYYKGRAGNPPPLAARAERYLQAGYQRLLNYQGASGGFTYWGTGDADPALTAYALRFLRDASALISVDDEAIRKARDWLLKNQQADGRWRDPRATPPPTGPAESRYETLLTSYVARVLVARVLAARPAASDNVPSAANNNAAQGAAGDKASSQRARELAAVNRALAYLAIRADQIDEPYLIASYAMAALDAGNAAAAAKAVERLRTLAHDGPAREVLGPRNQHSVLRMGPGRPHRNHSDCRSGACPRGHSAGCGGAGRSSQTGGKRRTGRLRLALPAPQQGPPRRMALDAGDDQRSRRVDCFARQTAAAGPRATGACGGPR